MNCHDIAAVLDEHRTARSTAAERSRVDAHIASCGNCAAAWHAATEFLAMSVPPAPASLRVTLRNAIASYGAREQRRHRTPTVIGSILLAGTALAAATFVTVTRTPNTTEVDSTAVSPVPHAADPSAGATSSIPLPASRASADDRPTSIELIEFGVSLAPISPRPPDYPPELLKERLEGHVQLRFDVSAKGIVENIEVVESSDPRFEEPAARALSRWRYLPRLAAGKRVASPGIHTIIRFALGAEPPPNVARAKEEALESLRAQTAFSDGLDVALDRFVADDLRGAELQLDEMYAVYELDGFRGTLLGVYGYLYTVQGNYGRAIDAYEAAIVARARSGAPGGHSLTLASLYFARHQYDMALKTLLEGKARIAEANTRNPYARRPAQPDPAVEAFIERLRALGVTEETLSPRALARPSFPPR